MPGGRFVIASDDNGSISPDGQALLRLMPLPHVTSAEAGWGRDPRRIRDFSQPPPYTFGNAPRNSIIGAGSAQLDLVVAKSWAATRGSKVEDRLEIFNLTNRTNVDLPNRIFGTPNFGRIFGAKNPRELQLGLRVAF